MENETAQAEGHTSESILDASDEQIDAMLRGDVPLPLQDSEPELEPEAEDDQQEQGEDLADQPEPEPAKEFATREELQKLQELLTGQQKKLDGQDLLLQRRASDIADVKQQLKRYVEQRKESLEDADPAQAAQTVYEIKEAEKEIARAEAEEENIGRIHTNQQAVSAFVKPQEWDTEAMLISLQRDAELAGNTLPRGFAESFRANPYEHGSPDGLVHLAKRSFAEKIATQAIAALQAMKGELDKKSKVKAEKVIQGVQGALRKPPPLNGSSGGSTKGAKSLRDINPENLPDDEIERLLAELR